MSFNRAINLTKFPDALSSSCAPLSPQVPTYSPDKLTKKLGAWSFRKGDEAMNLSDVQRALEKWYSFNSDSMSSWIRLSRMFIVFIKNQILPSLYRPFQAA